jgi:hypothetical protein
MLESRLIDDSLEIIAQLSEMQVGRHIWYCKNQINHIVDFKDKVLSLVLELSFC